jgi:hypothetical protein
MATNDPYRRKQAAEDDEPIDRTPMSVFYRGHKTLRKPVCHSFKPTYITQAAIEAERLRKLRRKPK